MLTLLHKGANYSLTMEKLYRFPFSLSRLQAHIQKGVRVAFLVVGGTAVSGKAQQPVGFARSPLPPAPRIPQYQGGAAFCPGPFPGRLEQETAFPAGRPPRP